MKICHIITSTDVGGAEQTLKSLLLSSITEKDKILIISLSTIGKVGVELQENGFRVEALNFKNLFSLPLSFFRLWRLIKLHQPSLVQTWLYHADFFGGLAARLAGVKYIFWGIRTTELRKGSTATAAIRKLNAYLSHFIPTKIICVAEASKKKHIALGYCANRMLIIPNGFDLTKFTKKPKLFLQLRQKNGIRHSDVVIGSIGRFSEVKGQDIFVKAAQIIAPQYPNVRFLMVGRELDDRNGQLIKWINDTTYHDRFILLGERSDIPICLGAMNIFCLHSRSEGFPNVLAEAMALGLPCVASEVGDAKLMGEGIVMMAKPNDPADLANSLFKVLEMSSEEINHLGNRCHQRIKDRYSMDAMIKNYQSLYQNYR